MSDQTQNPPPPRPGKDSAWSEVSAWRAAERERLIRMRLDLGAENRERRSRDIATALDSAIGEVRDRIVGTYWPFRGEPDLRSWGESVIARGGRLALPVVLEKNTPLEYRIWSPGDPLERGVWNILIPSRKTVVRPDVVIAPLVGFDEARYRLGYGGGFFDRTLAAMQPGPMTIGVGYRECRMPTIHPQPHDIAMDAIVAC